MYQRRLEVVAVLMMWSFMLLSAVSFSTSASGIGALARFARDTGISLDQGIFAMGSFLSALTVPLLLLPSVRALDPFWKRAWYTFSGFPLAAYTVPLGYYAFVAHAGGLGAVISVWIFLLMCLAGAAVYRPIGD